MIDWRTFSNLSMTPAGNHVLNVTMTGIYDGVDWDGHKSRFIDEMIRSPSQGLLPASPNTFASSHAGHSGVPTPERPCPHGLARDEAHLTAFRRSNGVLTVIVSGVMAAKLIERYEK
jgi:hypothetical protein